ncbi:MAG: bifunctional riboflavin kinase/FAD synthetase, partial [Chloroflexota bacterium]|nr:bifunctional riboflavin kinase/FAD synthetase [Chloroflexota bacterium]
MVRPEMRVINDLSQAKLGQDAIVTIGAFDGVHLGHQYLIKQLVKEARGTHRLASLVTFYPHPDAVLSPHNPSYCLTTPEDKIALLEKLGLDLLAVLPFDREMACTSAHDFIGMVCQHLRMKELWVGAGFALGRDREGNVKKLKVMGQEMGFVVHVVEPLTWQGEVVSSNHIRSLLLKGRVREAAQLLGRYPSLAGKVIWGAGRGRALGFPTANLEVQRERVIPADGVYAVYVLIGQKLYRGVANIGVRPTFEDSERAVEVHLLDFQGDLYGLDLAMEFVERLRSERWFLDVKGLKAQIEKDIARA